MREPLAVIGREPEVNEILAALGERFSGGATDAATPSLPPAREHSALREAIIAHGFVVMQGPIGVGATTLIEHLHEMLMRRDLGGVGPVQVVALIEPSVAHDTRALLTASFTGWSGIAKTDPGRINEDLTPEAAAAIAMDVAATISWRPTVILVDQIERYRAPLAAALREVILRCGDQVACIITSHLPDVATTVFGVHPADSADNANSAGTSHFPVVPLRALGAEDLWQITRSVLATRADPRSDVSAEEALRAEVTAPGVTAHLARLMGEAHLLGTGRDAHLLLNERISALSPQAIAVGTGIALWDAVLPITGWVNKRINPLSGPDGSGNDPLGAAGLAAGLGDAARLRMATMAAGLTQRQANRALRELQTALILDDEGRCHDRLWTDAFLGLAGEHHLERARISLADAVAGRTLGSVTDTVIIAELLSHVRTPPIRFSPWLKTAARAVLMVRADTSQRSPDIAAVCGSV